MRKNSLSALIILLTTFLFVLLIRIFFIGLYQIPSSSMSTTLKAGDCILVNKLSYGPRVINIKVLFKYKKLDFLWYKGKSIPRKGDVIVFNLPDFISLKEENFPCIFGSIAVKRCYGEAGDTIAILHEMTSYEKMRYLFDTKYMRYSKPLLFPYDSLLGWTLDRYGPLWIPSKGSEIALNPNSAEHYFDIFLYEGNRIEIIKDSVILNGTYSSSYIFKEDYYFMLGDNFYNSIDSRYFGLLPQKNIIGQAVFVIFSLDPDLPWYRKFRWDRFMKKIK